MKRFLIFLGIFLLVLAVVLTILIFAFENFTKKVLEFFFIPYNFSANPVSAPSFRSESRPSSQYPSPTSSIPFRGPTSPPHIIGPSGPPPTSPQ